MTTQATFQRAAEDQDAMLAALISDQLDLTVRLMQSEQSHGCGVPVVEPGASNIQVVGDSAEVRLGLPSGSILTWSASPDAVNYTVKLAEHIVLLHESKQENQQLTSEIESLAAQVMNDFEELFLIRSLASSIELPASGNQLTQFVLQSLVPMTSGVNAQSVAGVFTDDSEKVSLAPIWSNGEILTNNDLLNLIQDFREEATVQPVVKNNLNESQEISIPGLNEFMIVECRSNGRMHGWIVACNRVNQEDERVPWAQLGFTTVQASLLETVTNQLAAHLHNFRLLKQKENLFTEVVRALVNAVEARDPYTCGHSERVASFAKCLATLFGQSHGEVDRVYLTGLLHDVGKIAIPDGVLQKPGRLDDDERAIIETHTDAGWRILHGLGALQEILPGVLYHHEHFNGNGYPDGLVGKNIPIDGRILAVCDAFDAMTSDRPYRKGMELERACEILKGGAGEYWDPELIEIFLKNVDQFDTIRLKHKPREHAMRETPVGGVPIYSHDNSAPSPSTV